MKAFKITSLHQYVQNISLNPGTYTFSAWVFIYDYSYKFALKTSVGTWIQFDCSDSIISAGAWNKVKLTFNITQKCTQFDLMYAGSTYNCIILAPMLEEGIVAGTPKPNEQDLEEVIRNGISYWEINVSTPVIYKNSPSALINGSHSIIEIKGIHRSGSTATEGGYVTITANGSTESATATATPISYQPGPSAGKESYTIRLYDTVSKTTLLDTMFIPVVFKGAIGVGAINVVLSNDVDVLPASSAGTVYDYTGSDTDIRVFEGDVQLSYGTGNGQFQVSASGNGISVGSASTVSGSIRRYGVASNMTTDTATITFTITGKTQAGSSFTITKVQSFSKSKSGQKGDDAVAPIIIDGYWAFWDYDLQEYVKSAFSAIGDDGHSPYIDGGYWYEWDAELGEYVNTGVKAKGEDGDGYVILYRHSLTKPATPATGPTPANWTKNPDKGITVSTPTNWTLSGNWYQSNELTAIGNSLISTINIVTTLPNQVVVLELWADGYASYDYIYAGNLNSTVSTSSYKERVNNGRLIVSYDIPTAGSHSIQLMWRKGIATVSGSNRGYFSIIEDVKVWKIVASLISGVYQAWSEATEFINDSATEERVYCLSKTNIAPIVSDSDPYIDEYIPLPCLLSDYRGTFTTNRAYSIGQVVMYSNSLYKVVKAVTTSYSGNPTNTEYFEPIKGYTDNPTGASALFPYEFVYIRKKNDGLWSNWTASLFSNYGESGRGVSSVVTWFYKSSSSTSLTGGSWSTDKPEYSDSFFLWTKVVTTYSDSTVSETTPILDPDWHKILAITDKFGTTIGGVGFDSGLVSTVLILLRALNSLEDTAGLSGIQGALRNYPAYWAGGTYSEALALIGFLSKISSGSTPSSGEYDALAKITMLHNGAAKIGDFIVEPSGRIVMIDPSTGKIRLMFSTEDIPSIASLIAGTASSGSTPIGAGSTSSSSVTLTGSTNITKQNASASFNGSVLSISGLGSADGLGPSSAEATLYAYRNGAKELILGSVSIQFTSPFGVNENKTNSITISPLSVILAHSGLYTFKLEVAISGTVQSYSASSTASTFSWEHTLLNVNRQEYGKNGMMFFYSNNHFHFTEDGGLDLKGPTNMPGVLLSATVGGNGGGQDFWGPKQSASLPVRNSLGRYTIYHTIGHAKYQISCGAYTENRSWKIVSKSANSVVIEWRTIGSSPALSDTTFDLMLTGNNYN